jgi:hypothetical protein
MGKHVITDICDAVGGEEPCGDCDGEGSNEVLRPDPDYYKGESWVTEGCETCGGCGYVPTEVPKVLADPVTGEDAFNVSWHSTDAWRGYYNVEPIDPDAWDKLDEGAVCGEWEDVPPGTRTSEVEDKLDKLAEERDIIIIPAPTSNVFSMGYDCYARRAA